MDTNDNALNFEIYKLYLFFANELSKKRKYFLHNKTFIHTKFIYLFNKLNISTDNSHIIPKKFYYKERKTALKKYLTSEINRFKLLKDIESLKILRCLYQLYNYYIKHITYIYIIDNNIIYDSYRKFCMLDNNRGFYDIYKTTFINSIHIKIENLQKKKNLQNLKNLEKLFNINIL